MHLKNFSACIPLVAGITPGFCKDTYAAACGRRHPPNLSINLHLVGWENPSPALALLFRLSSVPTAFPYGITLCLHEAGRGI